jgi:hypothetical protein
MKQRDTIHAALTWVFLCLCVILNGQQLVNPSFEGATGVAKSPEGWQAYGNASSPDTQPGAWQVIKEAAHGFSYISMVCRGFSIYDSYQHESILQNLQNPLVAGAQYHYSIDLAFSKHFKADTITFNKPAKLRIWGMNEMQQKELLWESDGISNTDWKTFYFEVNPTQRTPTLILEAFYTQLPKYCGNVLIDNMQYYPLGHPNRHSVPDEFMLSEAEVESPDSLLTNDIDLNEYNLPNKIDGREVEQHKELVFKGNKLTITIWDNRTYDGDIVSLFLNEKPILAAFEISKNRLDIEIEVEEGKEYYLTLFAHNLGKIPPNTAALYISDGNQKKFLTLSSDLNKCEALKIQIVK